MVGFHFDLNFIVFIRLQINRASGSGALEFAECEQRKDFEHSAHRSRSHHMGKHGPHR